jgi:hypothetical protein
MTVEQGKCSVFWRGLPGRVLIRLFHHRVTEKPNCLEMPSLMVFTVQGFLCGSVTLW